VVFVHGWSGRWDQFLEMAQQVASNGFNVVVFDFPSHGANKGETSDVSEFAEFLGHLHDKIDLNNSFVVCHSAGFLAWSLFSKFKSVESLKLVLIGCPANFEYLINTFKTKLNFNDKIIAELWKIIGKRISTKDPQDHLKITHMAKIPGKHVLIVHDKNDKEVQHEESKKLSYQWPNSRFFCTEKLGHNRVLKNEFVIAQVLHFINSQ
jgi:hypothetical protein